MTPGAAGGEKTLPTTALCSCSLHFVTGGIHEALDRAKAAAAGMDVEIGGGVSTVRQYLEAGLIDELHVAIAPRLLGAGEHLFYGLDLPKLG
jgi:dihydrofolate reductase